MKNVEQGDMSSSKYSVAKSCYFIIGGFHGLLYFALLMHHLMIAMGCKTTNVKHACYSCHKTCPEILHLPIEQSYSVYCVCTLE